MKIIAVISISLAAALAAPGIASASTYCVGSSGLLCDVSKPGTPAGLQQALSEAEQSFGVIDRIRIAAGTYTGNFTYSSVNEVDISGAGAATVIQAAGSERALSVHASGGDSTVSDLAVHMGAPLPQQCAYGLRLDSAVADDIRVSNPANACGEAVELGEDAKLRNSTVDAGDYGIGIHGLSGGGTRIVSDSVISGHLGINATSGTWSLNRLQVTATGDGVAVGGNASLNNSLLTILRRPGTIGGTGLRKIGPGVLSADHVTIFGDEGAEYGVVATNVTADTAELYLLNSVVAGSFEASTFSRSAGNGAASILLAGHSNFAPPKQSEVDGGLGGFQEIPGTNTNLDPKFVDTARTLDDPGRDFRPRFDSPLVDHGQPGGVSGTDLARQPRLVDGDGTDGATGDMGAYEYQRGAPQAVIGEPAASTVAAGAPVAFSAGGSSDPDPGDTLEYEWSFGDGSGATGESASHTYVYGGRRTVTLTVKDPTGLTATATVELVVDGPPEPTGATADEAPVLSNASLAHSRLRFGLSEAATVRVELRRRSGGRVLARFSRKGAAGANSVLLPRRVRKRVRVLAPGRYRLVLVATDPAGNRSAPARVAFRVRP